MTFVRTFAVISLAVWLTSPLHAQPKTQLRAETASAFNEYVEELEDSLEKRVTSSTFLAAASRPNWSVGLRNGAIDPKFTERSLKVPGGLIQDWTATMFVPDVSGAQVVALLTNYDRHAELYDEVSVGEILSRNANTVRSRLRLRKHKVVTIVLDTEHEMKIVDAGPGRWQLRSRSTRINEIREAGGPDEQVLPEGEDSGFLWRMNAYWSIQEGDGGAYVECRSATLTRGIPFGLGWIVNRFTLAVPRESLVATLESTRNELVMHAD